MYAVHYYYYMYCKERFSFKFDRFGYIKVKTEEKAVQKER